MWALGSSRVLSFREQMFDTSFYNAGYTITSINDFIPFFQSIPEVKYPKYVIIGLDQWMFNQNLDGLDKRSLSQLWENSFNLIPRPFAYIGVWKDLLVGKYNFSLLKTNNSTDKIGLNAIVNNKGFTNDGSMYYGNQITKLMNNDPTANDYQYSNTLERIKKGKDLFKYGDSVNLNALVELDKLLKFCSENRIQLIAFLPPFADGVYKEIATSGNYGYINDIYLKVKPMFDRYGYEIYDFSTVSSVGSSDTETLDGFHGSELTYQRLLIKILESGSILNRVTDVNRLKLDLSKRNNTFFIYDR